MNQMYSSDGVRRERSGWRDEALSRVHRFMGRDSPCVDIDGVVVADGVVVRDGSLMLEYDQGMAAAILDYKNMEPRDFNLSDYNWRALRDLTSNRNHPIPLIIAFYTRPRDWMDRYQWVEDKYGKNDVPASVVDRLVDGWQFTCRPANKWAEEFEERDRAYKFYEYRDWLLSIRRVMRWRLKFGTPSCTLCGRAAPPQPAS